MIGSSLLRRSYLKLDSSNRCDFFDSVFIYVDFGIQHIVELHCLIKRINIFTMAAKKKGLLSGEYKYQISFHCTQYPLVVDFRMVLYLRVD